MFSWGMGVVLCVLLLLTGCSAGRQKLVNTNPAPPPEKEVSSVIPDADEPLTEELSAKRLEELYAKSGIPGWDPGLEEEMKKWDHQVKFDVPIHTNRQVRAYLVYFSTERKAVISRYLSRSTRYLPMIKEVFQEYGLPEDLAYLAMIESGFNPNAYSHAHACGMWQFIKGTGARYGLHMDSYVDERRDPQKSTQAAAKYLLDLYKQFGSWYLAAASYNCGEGRVQRELNQSKHKNFWELSDNLCLPKETKNYVPQMIAATIIAKNPEKFGFKNVPHLPPLAVDRVQVKETTSLRAAAVAINVPVEEIQNLNPELLRGITPPGMPSYTLKLPPKSQDAFAKNIMLASIEHPAVAARSSHAAKNGRGRICYPSPRKVAKHYPTRASSSERKEAKSNHAEDSSSEHKVAKSSHPQAAYKDTKKTKTTAAKSGGKKSKVRVASAPKGKQERASQTKTAVRTASMLPSASGSKSTTKKQGKVGSKKNGSSKVKKVAGTKSNSKKSNQGLSQKAGKTSKTSKNTGKGKSSSPVNSKYKGKSKSSKTVMVSKAR